MQCRIAPSLGVLEGHPNDVWGTTSYAFKDKPAIFFGLYGLPDFYALWRHTGKKYILWAGSDVRHFLDGYWLDDKGFTRLGVPPLADWISDNCESWVENETEREALAWVGIESQVCPSFLGNIDDYAVSYEPNGKYYASVSGNDFKLYGWDKIEKFAHDNGQFEFHLYGNTVPWVSKNKNVIVHGRVKKEKMNEEIKYMQGGLRFVEFDGFSEILAKSILWGQYPISTIRYKHMNLKPKDVPNLEGREYYKKIINQYPWNENK